MIIQCDSRLIPIFTKSFEFKVDFVSSDDFISEEDYDFHIPIGSLARLFRRSLSSFQQVTSGHLTVCHKKVRELKSLIQSKNASTKIEIDGGVNSSNAPLLKEAGADVLVAGSFVFKSENPTQTIADLKSI